MFCDCVELASTRERNLEGLLRIAILVSTLLVFTNNYPLKFFSEGPNSTIVLALKVFIFLMSVILFFILLLWY